MAEPSDSLIPVRKADITIGQPLPWAVYDANHVLLLNKGVVVSSAFQVETLMEKGMYREGRPKLAYWRPGQDEEKDRHEALREGEVNLPFDKVNLSPGDLLHIQPLMEGQTERYSVRVIGVLKPKSLLVTTPVIDGKVVFVKEGQPFLVRAFSGLNVCGFKARVLKSNLSPYPYLHLSYPASVQAMRIRKAMRAPVDIIIAIYDQEGGRQIAAGRIVDLSVGGARVLSPTEFGKKGGRVFITFKVSLDDIEEIVTTPAYIRSLEGEEDEKGRPMKVLGLQFGEITQAQRLIIMNLVYQHLFRDAT
ncbi:MAG: flagellar brake protein [Thiobacillaceae bacterium]|jgi:c-di-GMP-binding flagellar brake protein YcgR|nr:flagellar brake protein [Thiobacillaceae bacterium]